MAKTKLTMPTKDVGKLRTAIDLVDGKIIEDGKRVIGDETIVPVDFKTPASLFKAGCYFTSGVQPTAEPKAKAANS